MQKLAQMQKKQVQMQKNEGSDEKARNQNQIHVLKKPFLRTLTNS